MEKSKLIDSLLENKAYKRIMEEDEGSINSECIKFGKLSSEKKIRWLTENSTTDEAKDVLYKSMQSTEPIPAVLPPWVTYIIPSGIFEILTVFNWIPGKLIERKEDEFIPKKVFALSIFRKMVTEMSNEIDSEPDYYQQNTIQKLNRVLFEKLMRFGGFAKLFEPTFAFFTMPLLGISPAGVWCATLIPVAVDYIHNIEELRGRLPFGISQEQTTDILRALSRTIKRMNLKALLDPTVRSDPLLVSAELIPQIFTFFAAYQGAGWAEEWKNGPFASLIEGISVQDIELDRRGKSNVSAAQHTSFIRFIWGQNVMRLLVKMGIRYPFFMTPIISLGYFCAELLRMIRDDDRDGLDSLLSDQFKTLALQHAQLLDES